jgi:hypothetical protein
MAKIIGSFFNMKMSGALGEMVFDRRGFVRLKSNRADAQTTRQGDFRQTMMAAQKCTGVCGPATRQLVKDVADNPARWSSYLIKHLIGPDRSLFLDSMSRYTDPKVDQPGWEAAGIAAGLRPVRLEYAGEAEISPGAQLFMLASTLFSLGLYEDLGQPNGNAALWKTSITA